MINKNLDKYIKTHFVTYVTRDIERALGIEPRDGYFIITNTSSYAEELALKYPNNILLIKRNKNEEPLDTFELLITPKVQSILKERGGSVLVFKNTPRIEGAINNLGLKLLNPPSNIGKKIEEKISQISWLGDMASLLPKYETLLCRNLEFHGEQFVLQFNYGHSGDSTLLIKSDKDIDYFKKTFPNRPVKKTVFLEGPSYTQNIVINGNEIIYGNISYQITGQKPFTENTFSTVGNDWLIAKKSLTEIDNDEIRKIGEGVAKKMQKEAWRGLFGIDLKKNTKENKWYLIEINARQPASTTFESKLQKEKSSIDTNIFEAHLLSMIQTEIIGEITKIDSGAQIIQRLTHNIKTVDEQKNNTIKKGGCDTIIYDNKMINSDLIRIQTRDGFMQDENQLNNLAKNIGNLLIS